MPPEPDENCVCVCGHILAYHDTQEGECLEFMPLAGRGVRGLLCSCPRYEEEVCHLSR